MSRGFPALCFVLIALTHASLAAQESDSDVVSLSLTPPRLREQDLVQHTHPWRGREVRLTWRLDIDAAGNVADAELVEPHAAPDLPALAQDAAPYVRGLRFEPALRDGVPVPARIRFQHLLVPSEASTPTEHAAEPLTQAQDDAADDDIDGGYGASAAIDAPLQATSSLNLSGTSLRRRPYFNAGDLLNGAPGFYVVQHGGGGKAQQYFLRGFDADHGTDVALFVDDVPVNLPTHGHGQGYADLNWVIPELVETIEVRKGPFFAELGDHAVAGAVNYKLRSDLPGSFVTAQAGMFDTYRVVGATRFGAGASTPLLAAEVYRTNGPFEHDERYRRVSLFARATEKRGRHTFGVTAQSFLSGWNASGQIPLRAVRAGTLSRFGAVDPDEGGSAQRHALSADYRARVGEGSEVHVTGWLVRNRLQLYSNLGLFSGIRSTAT